MKVCDESKIEFLAPNQQRVFDVSGDDRECGKSGLKGGGMRGCGWRGWDQRVGCEGGL